jgi:hypothetical protein
MSADLYPYRKPKFIKFTPELWDRWREARKPTEQVEKLREGIREMRARLEMKR